MRVKSTAHTALDVQERFPCRTGGQGVAGSNPVSPTEKLQVSASIRRIGLRLLIFLDASILVPKRSPSSLEWPMAEATAGP